MNLNRFSAVVLILIVPSAFADGDGLARPVSTGMVFTSIADSAVQNPAGLVQGSASVYRLTYLNQSGIGEQDYAASMAEAGKNWGIGTTVSASNGSGGFSVSTATVGAGIGLGGSFSIGMNASIAQPSLSSFSNPNAQFAAGILLGRGNGFQAGATLSSVQDLSNTGVLSLGVGYAKRQKFQSELNLQYSLNQTNSPGYTLLGSSVFYFGKIGLGGVGSVVTPSLTSPQPGGYSYGILGCVTLGRSFAIDAKYSMGNSNALVTLGASLAF